MCTSIIEELAKVKVVGDGSWLQPGGHRRGYHVDKSARYDVQVEAKAPEAGLRRDSLILMNQVRTVDKQRLGRYWGRLPSETMRRVDRAIEVSLGLVPL